MSEEEKILEGITLRDYLDSLLRFRERGELGDWTPRLLTRLELIERLLPAWLNLPLQGPATAAIEDWDTFDFGSLIGRAVVLPIEQGDYFVNPTRQWEVCSIGLGYDGNRRGRPQSVGKLNQLLIYHLWASGAKTQAELAEDYGIGIATVGRIVRRWKPKDESEQIMIDI